MTRLSLDSLKAVLKRALKQRNINYRELGRRIGLSESGVKKLLGGGDITLGRVIEICDALDVSVSDVIAEASDASPRALELDAKQLEAFERDPGLLLFLWALLDEGSDGAESVARAARRLALDDEECTRRIAALQRVGLLERRPDGSLSNPTRGFSDWRLPASLGRKVMDSLQDELLRSARSELEAGRGELCELGMTRVRLRKETAAELKEDMRSLLREVSERGRRESALSSDELVPFGAMAVLAPFDLAAVRAGTTADF